MTLIMRSKRTLLKRIQLQIKAKHIKKKPLVSEQLFSIIDKIKSNYDIYHGDRDFPLRNVKKKRQISPNKYGESR